MKHYNESIYPSNSAVYPENDPEFLRKIFTIKLFGSMSIVFTFSCAALSFLSANNQLLSILILILTAVFLDINYFLSLEGPIICTIWSENRRYGNQRKLTAHFHA